MKRAPLDGFDVAAIGVMVIAGILCVAGLGLIGSAVFHWITGR